MPKSSSVLDYSRVSSKKLTQFVASGLNRNRWATGTTKLEAIEALLKTEDGRDETIYVYQVGRAESYATQSFVNAARAHLCPLGRSGLYRHTQMPPSSP